MKAFKNIVVSLILIVGLIGSSAANASAKSKIRLSVQYKKEMGQSGYILVKAKEKAEDGMQAADNLQIDIYRLINDSNAFIESIFTDKEGLARFKTVNDKTNFQDTSGLFTYILVVESNKEHGSAEKEISFKECILTSEHQLIDSINYIAVQLKDKLSGEPIAEEGILIGVERLFNQLLLDEMQYTDEDGMILLPYEDNIPAINKKLNFRITLSESEMYGTVITRINSNLGVEPEMSSTFDERTMWSPPSKTPWILLIIPNLIILGIWFLIIKLIYRLFKISTIKNNNHENL